MRELLFCCLLVSVFAAPAEAQAYRGGWCSVVNLGVGSVSERCAFRTFESCQAYASSFGSSSFCRVSGYPIGGPSRPAKKRAKYRY